jgi:hypothetical protein
VCGTARAGTTLLVRMLDGHPALAVLPWDTRIWPDLMDRTLPRGLVRVASVLDLPALTGLLGLPGLRRLAFRDRHALASRLHRWLHDFPDPPEDAQELAALCARVSPGAPYWGAFFEAFFRTAGAGLEDRPVRVEKTPLNELIVPLLDRLFGSSFGPLFGPLFDQATRYVHVVRDPRCVIASWVVMRDPPPERRAAAVLDRCVDWSRSAHRAIRGAGAQHGRYHVLRYEDLVARPGEVMADVGSFLGIGWHDALLRPTMLGAAVAPNSSYDDARGSAPGALVATQTRRFNEVLAPHEIVAIERRLHTQMEAWGYARDGAVAREGRPRRAARGVASAIKAWELARRQRGPSAPIVPGARRTWEGPPERSR